MITHDCRHGLKRTGLADLKALGRLGWSRLPVREDSRAIILALGPASVLLLAMFALGPIPQAESYHGFSDARALLGIPNILNVISNLPFAIVGAAGFRLICRPGLALPRHLGWSYGLMFAGIAATAFGSAFYHWSPDSRTLIWDRLPMAAAFMGLFAGFLSERLALGARTSGFLLGGLVCYGLASVTYWAAFDDLRLYAIAQFYPVIAIPVLMWRRSPAYSDDHGWLAALAAYGAAKALEELDGAIYLAGGLVSGHSLKHLAAAAGAWCIYRMLRDRAPLSQASALATGNTADHPPQLHTIRSQ